LNDLKHKAINSTLWSLIETFSNHGAQFIIGVILARLLVPEDYGLTSVILIFVSITNVLVDSGFKSSIIRSSNLSEIERSTIFYSNIFVSLLVGIILFISSEYISIFFKKPELEKITKLYSLIPIINGFGLVQSAILFKKLQFKRNAIISIISNLIAGIIAVVLALNNYSYWALVWKGILTSFIYCLLLWLTSNWRPHLIFSLSALKIHFRFSSKLLLTGIVDNVFNNIYTFIFGKYFSLKELGYYTRGKGYVDMATKTLSIAIQKVNNPILASANNNKDMIINHYIKLLRGTALLIFPITILLIIIAKPMIIVLIGNKWINAIPYLQIIAISGMIYPILNANSSLLEILGNSGTILKMAIISRFLQISILIFTLNFNGLIVAWGIVIHYMLIFFISCYYLNKITKIKFQNIISPLLKPLIISFIVGLFTLIIWFSFKNYLTDLTMLIAELTVWLGLMWLLLQLFKVRELSVIKEFILNKHNSFKF